MTVRHISQIADDEEVPVTSVFGRTHEHAVLDDYVTSDEKTLGALGYKQEFKRDFSLWECFSTSFSCLCLLPSIASTIGYSLGYSGTGGAVWGWFIAALCTQATALSMAELCSSIPTAGGLYYASAVLAPDGWGPFCSWFIGWSNICGYASGPCSLNYAMAAMLMTCGQIAYPTYIPETWHMYLTFLILLIFSGFITMQSTMFVGWVNKIGTIYNIAIVVVFVICLPVGSINSPKTNDSRAVWTEFENGTQWPIGWATVMGFLTAIWTLCGYDAPFHLAEECSNANIASPRAIIMTAQSDLYLGWAIILVIVYTVKDVTDIVSGAYGQPFGSLCLQVLGPRAGLALFALSIVAQFFGATGVTVTASRVVFAFARDGALPGSRWWRKIDGRTKTPVFATWGVLAVSALLGLLMFASPVAIGVVFSLGAIAQYTSFTGPIFLKLFFDRGQFKRGPWNLGRWSKPTNVVACAWWLLIAPALCFPAVRGDDLTPLTMNWTCVIYGGVMTLAISHFAVSGRKWFKGPRINVEHRGTQVVEVPGSDLHGGDITQEVTG
ncbi:amino acid transporter-like protein [Pseudomassariella vexata]|uniref:Amino acid transporter-like protein n=1 Tax=Pseudomassariella vexata TaxID=1141098 RepID=A0A1Y2E7G0_9PEZI|nr:amino acid transporter-like protein [Pseudomassariella vexata]ORY67479.1 amino acid transporter-like protein [Pseudomassariella vexata]